MSENRGPARGQKRGRKGKRGRGTASMSGLMEKGFEKEEEITSCGEATTSSAAYVSIHSTQISFSPMSSHLKEELDNSPKEQTSDKVTFVTQTQETSTPETPKSEDSEEPLQDSQDTVHPIEENTFFEEIPIKPTADEEERIVEETQIPLSDEDEIEDEIEQSEGKGDPIIAIVSSQMNKMESEKAMKDNEKISPPSSPKQNRQHSPEAGKKIMFPVIKVKNSNVKIPVIETSGKEEERTVKYNEGENVLTGYSKEGPLTANLKRPPSLDTLIHNAGFTRRQWLTLINFGIVEFFSAIVISLQAPFYPQEAEKKGATPTQYGFVFGVFELVVFLTSPIYGRYMNKFGPKLIFNLGIFTTGTCSILFGFLDRIDDGQMFIIFSFIVRAIEALGDAAFVTASFTIIAIEFPDSVATTFASMETFYGLGLIVGPTLGGALYDLGGFTLPFVLMGVLLFVSAILTAFVMPNSSKLIESESDKKASHGFGFWKLISIPSVALCSFSVIASAISIGYNSATLEPHIRPFHLTAVLTGFVFIIPGGTYAITAPAWGWLCDKALQPKYITLLGSITIITGFCLIGPLPIFPTETLLWLTCLGLFIQGIGLGASLVSSFLQALRESIKRGYPDNVGTYGLVSGLWVSAFAFGSFVGPSVSGVLYDTVGFRNGTYFVIAIQLIVVFFVSIFIVVARNGKKNEDLENEPLMKSFDPIPSTSKQAKGYGAI